MLRDRGALMTGLLLPGLLILLFGYGLSFDVRHAPIAVVMLDKSPTARSMVSGLHASEFVAPLWVDSAVEAEDLMREGKVVAMLTVPSDFSKKLLAHKAVVQLSLNGTDFNTATSVSGYVASIIGAYAEKQLVRRAADAAVSPGAILISRTWFNERNESTWFLVPGLTVLIMTLIGAFLTSLLVAREWERGTLEVLFTTPAQPIEIVLAKLVPFMVVGAIDLGACLAAARWLFDVPIRGSIISICSVSMLYLLVSLSLGLFISATSRNQFAASQIALLISFMPALMLSGFVFDLENVPQAIQWISQALPATHFMGLIRALFLAGDNWSEIFRVSALLAAFGIGFVGLTCRALRKELD